MVIWGHSVLYLTDVDFTVRVVRPSDRFGTVRRTESLVQMGLRVPGIQRARFERLLERAHSGVDDGLPLPVDDEPDAAGSTRYPPESMVAGVGIGFSMIVALQGAEAVLLEALSMIRRVDANLPWARDWTPAELVYVQSQLTPRFTREALTSHASVVFQPGGVRMEIFRPARSGWEVITVIVAATHGDEPSALGRVDNATLEVMPSAFAGQGGDDTVGSSANVNVTFDATLGLGVRHFPKGLGFLAQGSAARSVTATTSAGATGFSLQAMLYVGPARLFTYDNVKYQIDVKVRHQTNISPGLAHWWGHVLADEAASAARNVASALSAPGQPPAANPAAALTSTLPGLVQFISHEDLAREAPVDRAEVREVGRTEVIDRFGKRQDWLKGRIGRTATLDGRPAAEVRLPAIGRYLAGDGHVVIDADAQVMGVLTGRQFGQIVRDLLAEVGLDDDTVRDLPWVITEPAHVAAAVGGVRPGAIRHTFIKRGNPAKTELQDRHAVLTIEGFPTNAREASPNPVKLFQMHVAEGGPVVGSEVSTTTLLGFNVGIPGLSMLFGKNSFAWLQEFTWGHGWYSTEGTAANLTLTAGRLTQATQDLPGVDRRHGVPDPRDRFEQERGGQGRRRLRRRHRQGQGRHQLPDPQAGRGRSQSARAPGAAGCRYRHANRSPPGLGGSGARGSAAGGGGAGADAPGPGRAGDATGRRPPHDAPDAATSAEHGIRAAVPVAGRHRRAASGSSSRSLARPTRCWPRWRTCSPSTPRQCSKATGPSRPGTPARQAARSPGGGCPRGWITCSTCSR